jgi:hypothetical protein
LLKFFARRYAYTTGPAAADVFQGTRQRWARRRAAPARLSSPGLSPEGTEIVYGSTAEFFDGALIIGGEVAGGSISAFNLTTHEIGCPNVYFRVGEQKTIIGKRPDGYDFFRITLLKVADKSSTVRVEELPPKDWPAPETRADDCTYYIDYCPS